MYVRSKFGESVLWDVRSMGLGVDWDGVQYVRRLGIYMYIYSAVRYFPSALMLYRMWISYMHMLKEKGREKSR